MLAIFALIPAKNSLALFAPASTGWPKAIISRLERGVFVGQESAHRQNG